MAPSVLLSPLIPIDFYTLVSVNRRATRKHRAQSINLHFSLLFISGADDPIGNLGKGVHQTVNDLKQ